MSCYDIALSRWGWALTSDVAPKVHEICKIGRKKENVSVSSAAACGWSARFHAATRLLSVFRGRRKEQPKFKQVKRAFVLAALCGVKNSQSTYEPTWKVGDIIRRGKSKALHLHFVFVSYHKSDQMENSLRGIHHHRIEALTFSYLLTFPFSTHDTLYLFEFWPLCVLFWLDKKLRTIQSGSQLVNQ